MSILQEVELENMDPILDRIKSISYISRDFGHAIGLLKEEGIKGSFL